MRKTKKAPSGEATQDEAKEAAALTGTAISSNNYIISECREQGFIASLLPYGESNAIPADRLAELSGYKSVRQLQRAIESERARGALILSTGRGYSCAIERKKAWVKDGDDGTEAVHE